VFLVGSVISGAAPSMFTLIAARAIQGLGAGAIIPMSMTIVGELYTLSERARTQALFSGVWGIASIAGPLVGGYITDALSWRWVFYLNVPFGFCCMAVIALAYPAARLTRQVQVDWLGAALLFSGISTLLIAIGGDAGSSLVWLCPHGLPCGRLRGRSASSRGADSSALARSTARHLAHDCRGLPGRHRNVWRHRFHPALRAERPGRHFDTGGTGAHAAVSGLGRDVDRRRPYHRADWLPGVGHRRQHPDDRGIPR